MSIRATDWGAYWCRGGGDRVASVLGMILHLRDTIQMSGDVPEPVSAQRVLQTIKSFKTGTALGMD
eukprot:11067726-Alexandrium_andersonii.AAC.1